MVKSDNIAILSLILSVFRVISGPVTLLLLTVSLSSEMMGFYFAFYGVIAIKMLFEAGMSNVIKLNYAHHFKNEKFSVENINKLFSFSIIWYLAIALILTVFLSILGWFYFKDYTGDINWLGAWVLLVITTSLSISLTFVESYLDGCQKQIQLKYLQLTSSLSIFSLWLGLYFGFGLYAIGAMQLTNLFLTILYILSNKGRLFNDIDISINKCDLISQFWLLCPLLKKVSLVWFVGYFFWNGFNLISFKIMTPELAGKVGLTLALAKAGYTIASSLLTNQMTYISSFIARRNYVFSLDIFNRYLIRSTLLLITGYSFYVIAYNLLEQNFAISTKVLGLKDTIFIFVFFIITHIFVSLNNYVRAYKVEPFVLLSTFNAIFTVVSYTIGVHYGLPYFLFPVMILLITLCFSLYIFYSYTKSNN